MSDVDYCVDENIKQESVRAICADCGQHYRHCYPVRIVCPKCNGASYDIEEDECVESVGPIIESTVPRLLLD